MTTLLTGTLERTAAWLHVDAPRLELAENLSNAAHAHAQRALPFGLRLRQWLCGASRGHAFLRGVNGPRMYLICQHCFHETSGWEVDARRPRTRD
jgi:hypothetical protein